MKPTEEITIADVIIEAMPFSAELNAWSHKYPNFKQGLKFTNSDTFLPLGAVFTSHPKNHPEHQVVGFVVYDMKRKMFKQDYILNVNGADKEFILYSKVPGKMDDAQVKHIKDFFSKYDTEGGYEKDHWLTVEDIDEKAREQDKPYLAEMAHNMMRIAKLGPRKPTEAELREVLSVIRKNKLDKLP